MHFKTATTTEADPPRKHEGTIKPSRESCNTTIKASPERTPLPALAQMLTHEGFNRCWCGLYEVLDDFAGLECFEGGMG